MCDDADVSLPRTPQTSRAATIRRRVVSIPGQAVAAVALTLLLPVVLVLALLVDLVFLRIRLGTVRLVLLVVAYLWIGVAAQIWSFWIWLRFGFGRSLWSEAGQQHSNRMIGWWIDSMLGALRVVGFRIEWEGDQEMPPGPIAMLSRHESLADVYVPTKFILRQDRRIRVVLAAGLRGEPALDVVGHRTPQFFVRREGSDMRKEVEGIRRMTEHHDDTTGFCIFPEGGLARRSRRERVLAKLDETRPDLAARARRLRHLLPPRPPGAAAILEGAPTASAVFIAHVGLDTLTDPETVWRSMPMRQPIEVRSWVHPPATIPTDPAEREAWLFDQWQVMDDWIEARRAARGELDAVTAVPR